MPFIHFIKEILKLQYHKKEVKINSQKGNKIS
jgi:hypothetical protein